MRFRRFVATITRLEMGHMALKRMDNVGIVVDDLAATIEFYGARNEPPVRQACHCRPPSSVEEDNYRRTFACASIR
jgi:hypothetical protein